MARYGLVGPTTRTLLTYRGAAIVHDNRDELQYLVPGGEVVRLTDGDLGQPVLPLRQHPDFAAVRWPLDRRDFVTP